MTYDSIMTHFIYPIEHPICISEKLGIYLENLSDQEDILELKKLLEISMSQKYAIDNNNHKMRIPLEALEESISVESGIRELLNAHRENRFIQQRLTKHLEEKNFFQILSESWVVVRFDEDAKIYKDFSDAELQNWFASESEHPTREHAINFTYLLCLLRSKDYDGWDGRSFALPELDFFLIHPEPTSILNMAIFYFVSGQVLNNSKNLRDPFFDFESEVHNLQNWGKKIDAIIDKKTIPKLMYIGNLLKSIAFVHIDSKLKFIIMVSIIELILTHNPNFNRFNVEDSISKQFKLKTIVLAFLEDESIDLSTIKSDLTEIYNQRSNIAHGNFNDYQKFISKGLKQDEDTPEVIFWELTSKLWMYVRIVVSQFILRKEFVDFIKEN